MNWYEAIYIRKSVRRYSTKAVPAELLKQIKNCAEKLKCLQEDSECCVELYNAREAQHKIKGPFCVNAPYYMAVFTKKTSFSLVEAGCYAQRLVLYMTTKGLGTCYQGGCKLKQSEIPENMQLAIVIAFGYAERGLVRNAEKASRQPLNRLCRFRENAGEEIRTMLKTARLAPSAFNRQPWRFAVWSDHIDLYLHRDPILKHFFGAIQLIDAGIVLCHLLEAADEQWYPVEVKRNEKLAEAADRSRDRQNQYIATIQKQVTRKNDSLIPETNSL
ncbi:MAG: nitroreductase family protein [Lachnospiraceae bacterium]|nr:nitroreductase family protein [Lachnospiraceae bacterium]